MREFMKGILLRTLLPTVTELYSKGLHLLVITFLTCKHK